MRVITLLILFAASLCCQAEPVREQRFREAVDTFITAFNAKDSATINGMIHPDAGIHVMTRLGVFTTWSHLHSLCLEKACEDDRELALFYRQALSEQILDASLPLQYGPYPKLTCDQDPPPEPALITDPQHSGTVLAETMRFFLDPMYREAYDPDVLRQELERMQPFETNSRKVMLISRQGGYFSNIFQFYLSYIDGTWYLINIDYASMDCSA